ncbi:MAG: hypothetical protein QOF70_6426 [Acetobacteraceae bacterium]|jgi:hypothetical protein|nr:hypothetical protein [Acetobacteraceae bacterium]
MQFRAKNAGRVPRELFDSQYHAAQNVVLDTLPERATFVTMLDTTRAAP